MGGPQQFEHVLVKGEHAVVLRAQGHLGMRAERVRYGERVHHQETLLLVHVVLRHGREGGDHEGEEGIAQIHSLLLRVLRHVLHVAHLRHATNKLWDWKLPADEARQADNEAAGGVLLLEGGLLLRLRRRRVDRRDDTHEVREGDAELLHGSVGEDGCRHTVVVLEGGLQSKQTRLDDLVVFISGKDCRYYIDILHRGFLLVSSHTTHVPYRQTRPSEPFPPAPLALGSEARFR